MTAKVILNPYAGRWTALKRRPDVEEALRAAGIDYELALTEQPGHGTSLAAEAVHQGFTPIISAGGDGSISEVVNGILQACNGQIDIPFGILPLGSANDLVVNLGLPKDLNGAAQVLASGKVRNMDIGQVSTPQTQGVRYFDNNSAIGLEPTITLIQQRITWLRGTLRYLLATLLGVFQNPHWSIQIQWDGGEYKGPATLVTVGNNPITGGLFYMTPHADPFDGRLTFVYGYMATRLQVLRLLPRTMKPAEGSYVEHPSIHEVHSTWLRIHTDTPTPLHADGEIQSESVQDIEYQILPAKLPVILK